MRIHEIITERFQNRDTYNFIYARILAVLRDIAPKITKYKEGEYYAGDVMDELTNVLDKILYDLMDERVRYLFFLLKQNTQDLPSGCLSRPGNGNTIFTVSFPKAWVSYTPNMFFYAVRDNGKEWAASLAATFVHELTHLEQQIRQGDRAPRGGFRRVTADTTPGEYLSSDDEIGAQAVSTALELIQWVGDAKTALSYFLRKGSVAGLALSTLIPHLSQNCEYLRSNREAWNRYLKAVIWNLQHHIDP